MLATTDSSKLTTSWPIGWYPLKLRTGRTYETTRLSPPAVRMLYNGDHHAAVDLLEGLSRPPGITVRSDSKMVTLDTGLTWLFG
ncbi:hypothetical protein D3C84_1117380 [compost metagenome]